MLPCFSLFAGPHCKLAQAATPSPASLTNSDGSTNVISSGSSASDASSNTAAAALQIHAANPTAPPSDISSEPSVWPRSALLSAPAGATATLSEATPPVADPCNRDGFSAPIPTLHLAPAHKPLVQRRSAAIAVAMGSACPGSPRSLGRISYDCDSGAAVRHHADRHEGSASPGHWPSHGHGYHGHHGHHGQCRTSTRTSRGREALPAAYQFAQLISDAGSAAAAAAGAGSIFGGAGAADGGVPRLWPGPALRVKPRAIRGSSCPTEGACHGPASALALGGGSVGGVTSPVLGSAALAGATSPMFVSGPSPTWVLSSRVSRGPSDLGAALGLTALAATTPGHSPAHSSGLGSPFAGKGPVSGCGGGAAARAGSSSERRSANGGRPLVLTPRQSRGSGGGSFVAAPLMDCVAAGGGAHRLSASSSCSSLHQAARSKMLASAGTLAVPAGGRSSALHGGRVYTTRGSTSLPRRGARGFGGLGPRSGSTGNLPLLAETHAIHAAPGFPPRLARMHEAGESSGSNATPRHSLSAGAHAAAWSYTRA